MNRPIRILGISCAVVALTTAIFPLRCGAGGRFCLAPSESYRLEHLVAGLRPRGKFADLHTSVVWPVAAVLNVLLYSTIAVPVWAVFRKRGARIASLATICWLLFYVAMLFILFPATDGP